MHMKQAYEPEQSSETGKPGKKPAGKEDERFSLRFMELEVLGRTHR